MSLILITFQYVVFCVYIDIKLVDWLISLFMFSCLFVLCSIFRSLICNFFSRRWFWVNTTGNCYDATLSASKHYSIYWQLSQVSYIRVCKVLASWSQDAILQEMHQVMGNVCLLSCHLIHVSRSLFFSQWSLTYDHRS